MYDEIFNNFENDILIKDEIHFLLESDDCSLLFKKSNEIREKYIGNEIHLRGIIEFSNYCKRQCLYCGIQSQNSKIKRYRMEKNEIIETAVNSKYKTIVLQSGEDNYYTDNMICEIVKEITKKGFVVTLSIGEKSYEQLEKYRLAGARRYLLKHETSDVNLYGTLNPRMSFEQRITCQNNLKSLNYEVGSGIMIGLPLQTLESIANDIMFFRKMDYDMIGISPFIPHPDTVLAKSDITSLDLVKKVVAITRIITKTANLPVTTAFSTLGKDKFKESPYLSMLKVGANVIMPNITPLKYKMNYELYPDKSKNTTDNIEKDIKSIKRVISDNYGFRVKI